MDHVKRLRPSPAMIVAIVALVLSLGGTSYAAIVLPAGSVGTTQLKKNAVVGSKVKNGSLTVADISAASLSKLGRVAIASGHVNVASNASSRVVQVSITAPSKGFVLVNGWVNTDGASGQYTVRVWDDGASTHSPYLNGDYVTAGESTCGNAGVFPVAAGVQKFSVRIESNTAGDMEAWGTITAQFIPYNGIGTQTAP
ncbi:MAG TPA: hypothetical protein VFZ86_02535, partial [Thermoleophilia bacterium]|nr:hypothetical protein [Thermoleophilia bacterium]